jgi:hypothetical protein
MLQMLQSLRCRAARHALEPMVALRAHNAQVREVVHVLIMLHTHKILDAAALLMSKCFATGDRW